MPQVNEVSWLNNLIFVFLTILFSHMSLNFLGSFNLSMISPCVNHIKFNFMI